MTTTAPDSPPTAPSRGPAPRRGRGRWWRTVGVIVIVTAVLAAGAWLVLQWLRPHPYSGTIMQAPTAAPSMEGLVLSGGAPVDIDAYRGDLLLVYFGYTSCPDVCPTTLSQVAAARRRLGDDAERVRLLMVSIDPERDAPDLLGAYVTSFDPTFEAAAGELAVVEQVATQYGIYFAKGEPLGDGYSMDHTATLMGIDPAGHLRIVWPAQLDVDRLADDFDALL